MPSKAPIISQIHFHFLRQGFTLANRSALKAFMGTLFKKEKTRLGELNYIFCSDDYLLQINRQFLNHDFYTDIVSFDLSEPGQPLNAEIYISVDRIRDNAKEFGSSFKKELHRVIFHGALHLCGYSDKKTKQQQIMRKMEDKYLSLYF